jgi:transposase
MKKRMNHGTEEKIWAVLEANRPGNVASDVAKKVGVHTFSLYRWKKELRDAGLLVMSDREIKVGKPTKVQLSHVQKLEKENRRLRMENDLLKKAHQIERSANRRFSKRSKP